MLDRMESQDSTESREAGTDRGEGGLVLELPPDNSNGGFGGYEEGRGPSPKRMLRPTRSFAPSNASNASLREQERDDTLQNQLNEKAVLAELALSACDDVQVHGAPIKTKARMREKVKCYQDASAWGSTADDQPMLPLTACILDPVRASVVCNGPKAILAHVAWFINSGSDFALPSVRIKNKFAMQDSSEYDGYRDLMISVLYTGDKGLRIIGEIQLHDRRMYELKVKMHKLYKVKRATSADQIQ